MTVADIDDTEWRGLARLSNLNYVMEDHKCVKFPLISSRDPLGILDDMQADSLLTDRAHPPIIFGAGGPMYV